MADEPRPRLSGPTRSKLDEIIEENEYSSYDQAIRHALREAGYDV